MVGFLLVTGISNAVFPQLTASHHDKIARKMALDLIQKLQAQQAALDAQNQQADKPDPAPSKKTRKGKKDKSSDKDKSDKAQADKQDVKILTPKESASAVLEKINEHHLSWYYLTDGNQKPLDRKSVV